MGFDGMILRVFKLKSLILELETWAEGVEILSAEQLDTGTTVSLFHSMPAFSPAAGKNKELRKQ